MCMVWYSLQAYIQFNTEIFESHLFGHPTSTLCSFVFVTIQVFGRMVIENQRSSPAVPFQSLDSSEAGLAVMNTFSLKLPARKQMHPRIADMYRIDIAMHPRACNAEYGQLPHQRRHANNCACHCLEQVCAFIRAHSTSLGTFAAQRIAVWRIILCVCLPVCFCVYVFVR